jgi:AcrR family transcriptional regulator
MTASPKLGRRPAGDTSTRDEILDAARSSFASVGYDRTSMRGVAKAAGVDPSLVLHYFGSKEGLFADSLRITESAQTLIGYVASQPRELWGSIVAEQLLRQQQGDSFGETWLAIIRSAASEPTAAQMVAHLYETRFLREVSALHLDHPQLRATMLSSIVTGLTFTGQIIGLPGFRAAPREQQLAMLGAVIQLVFTVELPDG